MWRYVALFGAMWRYPAIRKRQTFLNFCIFGCFQETSKNSGGTMWRYVALCGAMWCYPAIRKGKFLSIFVFLAVSGNLQKQWWHYVALCGAMWRYVALCGAMWRYPAIRKRQVSLNFCLFGCFQETSKNSGGTKWRYVALCGAIP